MKLIKLFEQFIGEEASKLSSAEAAFGAQGPQTQDRMRAIFLYGFTRFFEWPDYGDPYKNPDYNPDSFTIYVVGNDSNLVHELKTFTDPKAVGYRKIVIINSPAYDSKLWDQVDTPTGFKRPINPPAIMYFGPGTAIVKNPGSLIVAETPGACARGASINFQVVDNKLRFEYSQSAAVAAGLNTKEDFKPLATKLV